VNTHCAAKFAAFARLQVIVNWMMRDHRLWFRRLRRVPLRFSLIKLGGQRQLKPPLPDGLF
jgi:hypothetical protein